MGYLIFLISATIVIVGAGLFLASSGKVWALGLAVVAAVLLWLSFSISIVSAGSQKVQTSFGKVTGVNEAGWNWVAPWSSGTSFSTRNQWIEFKDDPAKPDDKDEPRIPVRLAGQATADVFGIIEYTQPADAIDDLYLTWKEEDRIRSVFVYNQAKVALNEAFGVYDPLANAKLQEDVFGVYGRKATEILQGKIGGQLAGLKISITNLDLDDKTEDQLRSIQAAIAQTRVAAQAALTADQIALANKTIAASLSSDPVVAFYQCSAMWTSVLKEVKPQNLNISSLCASTIGVLK